MLLKKIGIGCGVMATLFVVQISTGLSFNRNRLNIISAEEFCRTEEECEELINSARNRISNARAEEEAARLELGEVENDLTIIVDRIDTTEEAITRLRLDIARIEARIMVQEKELVDLDTQVTDLNELILQRMRVTQRMNNSNSILEILSDSESFVDLIRRVRAINRISISDAELMGELNTLIERQQDILASLQEEQVVLASNRKALEEEIIALEDYKNELEAEKERIAHEIQRNENIILTEEEAIRIAEEQQRILEEISVPIVTTTNRDESGGNSTSGTVVNVGDSSGKFIIPLPSGTVTCEWLCYTGHSGIDLSSTNRSSPILAAATGTVVTSGWHNAYGNWVVIEHNIDGLRYATLYAHMASAPMVDVGDTVSQGQQIGIMGSTGNSTGPHLHFEIHPGGFRWGGAVNPRYYIEFPPQGRWW